MILALLRLIRPWYSVPLSGGLIVIAAYAAGGELGSFVPRLLWACVSLFLVISWAYVLNDLWDVRFDAINNPDKVIPKGLVSAKLGSFVHGVLLISGFIVSTFCGWRYFAVLSVTACGLVIYNRFSKRLGIFKDILAAALTTSLYPLALSLTDPVITPRFKSLYIFPVWLFLTGVGYEMLKDIRDIKGDNISGQATPLAAHSGFHLSARIILVVAGMLAFLPYVLGYCGTVYLVSSIIAVVLVIAAVSRPAVKAIPFIYVEVFLIAAGSLADLWVYSP